MSQGFFDEDIDPFEDDYGFDEDFDDGFADGFDEDFDAEFGDDRDFDSPPERRGGSRAFLIGVAVLAALFILSLCAVGGIVLTRGPNPTAVAIETENALRLTQLAQTQTQAAFETATEQTAVAMMTNTLLTVPPTETPTATPTEAPTDEPTPTEGTPEQVGQLSSPTPDELTPTRPVIFVTATPLPTTPTAVAGLSTPTPESGVGGPGSMPDTGVFDDLGIGGGLAVALGLAFALLGVIFVSRRLRMEPTDDSQEGEA